jgi:hypothetical protein
LCIVRLGRHFEMSSIHRIETLICKDQFLLD